MKQKLTQEYLKECLTYDPETGIFTWKERPVHHFESTENRNASWICNNWNSKYIMKRVGCYDKQGYILIGLDGIRYKAHRLAWLYIEGYMPEYEIDHINRRRDDNRWSNLRHVSRKCNMQNRTIQTNNTSGVTGVTYNKILNTWTAQMGLQNKKYIGTYKKFEDAVLARYNEEQNNLDWNCSIKSSAEKYLKENNLI